MAFSLREFLSYWLPPLLGMGAILGFSGDLGSAAETLGIIKWLLSGFPFLSPARIEMIHYLLRKGGHVLAYGVLYFLWFRAFQGHLSFGRVKAILCTLTVCLLVAMMDEGHQLLLPSRTGSLRDIALDMTGSTLGAVMVLALWGPAGRGLEPRRGRVNITSP